MTRQPSFTEVIVLWRAFGQVSWAFLFARQASITQKGAPFLAQALFPACLLLCTWSLLLWLGLWSFCSLPTRPPTLLLTRAGAFPLGEAHRLGSVPCRFVFYQHKDDLEMREMKTKPRKFIFLSQATTAARQRLAGFLANDKAHFTAHWEKEQETETDGLRGN